VSGPVDDLGAVGPVESGGAVMTARVCDLVGGDVVDIGGRTGTFIGRSDHPRYPSLALVVWRLDNGTVSFDALSYQQEVGEVVSDRDDWSLNLHAALGAVQ